MSNLKNICKLSYTSIQQVTVFVQGSADQVLLTGDWIELPIIPGATLSIRKSNTKAGRLYTSDFNASLRSKLDLHQLVILRVELDDGDELILGDPDHPIRVEETVTTRNKPISLTHQDWHYPWSYAGEPAEVGSGSAGGGI
jgi:hypothetical protein